jgi:hypothetical protein
MLGRSQPVRGTSAPDVRPQPTTATPARESLPTPASSAAEEPKQLTHLTKGRARGPKKRNSIKRTVIKAEPDSPPPKVASVWPKPTKVRGEPTPAIETRARATQPRDREKASSPTGSMKQRLADLSPLRRDSKSSFFGNLLRTPTQVVKPRFPTVEVLPSPTQGKFQDKERLFVQAWSIVSRVKHVSLKSTEEHVLYSKDMHAFLYMYNDEPGASEPSAIKFLWVGRECTQPEKEGHEFIRLMGDQNADTQVIHQGYETALFMRALGGVIVTRNGTRRGLDTVEDSLFCVREWLGGISIDELAFQKSEFCSGFSYVVKKDGNVFVWHGNGAITEEIAEARRFAGEIGQVKEMMEGDPAGCAELWKCFEDHEYASGEFWRAKVDLNGFNPKLYILDGQKVAHFEKDTNPGPSVVGVLAFRCSS